MTQLPTTGPPMLDLRWEQITERRSDGRLQRVLYPHAHHQEADGYMHPGVATAAVIGAAEKTVGLPDPLVSVAVGFAAPAPLGMDLAAVVDGGDGSPSVELEVLDRPDVEAQPLRTLAHASLGTGHVPEVPNPGAFRSAAISPVADPAEHELYPRCFVCGQDNPQGLGLLPGWQEPDTVVTAFTPSERMTMGERVPPTMVAVLLSCPTLWACSRQLEDLGGRAALLTTYEVHFLEDVPPAVQVRTVGLAGEPTDRALHGTSALIGEDGRLHAVATASWQALDEVPARETGRPDPAWVDSPLKGGRPEGHSDRRWGRPLPGRRETAGPRSERADDHDRRAAMGVPVERHDPAEPRRSIIDDDR